MDQDETWHGVRPWPRPHCARWVEGTALQFLAHVYCGKTAGWIKMPLGTKIGLGPGHIVLDRAQLPPKRGHTAHQFSADVYCGQKVANLS